MVVVLTTLAACSTKKNTFTRRVYHNLTAHYNAYFNGKEAYNEAVAELGKRNKDNFARVIPVFQYGTKEEAQSQSALFDRAIEKGSKVIAKHSIYIKRVEYVRWIDDAYLLIGKSYLYKQEYDMAVQAFNFIRERYKGNPIVNDALLYQVRTYSQMGRFSEAEGLLAQVDKKITKNKASRHVEKHFPLVMADYHLQQGNYGNSVEFLEQAVRLNKNKKVRMRTSFVLAQVYERLGNLGKATEYYRKVLDYNPVYEMEFACKINMAKCFDASEGDSRDIKKLLARMLKDEKNKDFLDQIYYALAEVYQKENNRPATLENLKLSARSSTTNNYQKGISYLKLGDLYYQEAEYRPAQMFYDSAVMALPKDFPNLSTIEAKKNTLTELVKNMNVVDLEDSLQRMGRMPYAQRLETIDRIIRDLEKEEQRKRQEEIDRQNALANLQQMGFQNPQSATGKWYFENPQTIAFGITEFNKKWGNRKLEDLWRLSNKVAIDFSDEGQEGAAVDSAALDSTGIEVFNPKDRNAYLKVIPATPEAFAKSDRKIIEALYNIGVIYKDGLMDYEKSEEAFATLFNRFPDNEKKLPAYYYLYRIYTEQENTAQAEKYKNLIISQYPSSDYAKIIADPNYYEKQDSIKGLEEKEYGRVYAAYQAGDYAGVIQASDQALHSFSDKALLPRFAYLRAISIGKTRGDSALKQPLQELIAAYPSSPVTPMAQSLLNYLQYGTSITPEANENQPVSAITSPYVFDPQAFHFYIAVLDAVKVKINEVKSLFSDHNMAMFKLDKLTVNSMYLNNTLQMITVNRFDNKDKAMDYMNSVKNNVPLMSKLSGANMQHFVISASNYTTFYKLKDVAQYLDFFEKNYLAP